MLDNMKAIGEKKDIDSYRLNGKKTFVVNGTNADAFLVAVHTGSGTKHNSISFFLVERAQLTKVEPHDIQGTWSSGNSKISLESVVVSSSQLVGDLNKGWDY